MLLPLQNSDMWWVLLSELSAQKTLNPSLATNLQFEMTLSQEDMRLSSFNKLPNKKFYLRFLKMLSFWKTSMLKMKSLILLLKMQLFLFRDLEKFQPNYKK